MSAASGARMIRKSVCEGLRSDKYGKQRTRWRLAQMPKQLSGSTGHSDILVESTNSADLQLADPFARPMVDPDVSAASPSHHRSRSMLFGSCLVGVVLAGGTSAFIAFRQFSLADSWRDHVSSWAQLHRPTLTMRGEQAIRQCLKIDLRPAKRAKRFHAGDHYAKGKSIRNDH